MHVFNEVHPPGQDLRPVTRRRPAPGRTGTARWTWATRWDSTGFAAGLDRSGSGLVLGTPGTAIGYPVLARQDITFTLSKSSVKKGRTVTGSGTVRARAPGRLIKLQAERGGRWYTVGSTHETASGTFRVHHPR